jgi:hypothetical protein
MAKANDRVVNLIPGRTLLCEQFQWGPKSVINPRLSSMVTAAAASLQLRNQGVGQEGPVSERMVRRLNHAPEFDSIQPMGDPMKMDGNM